jgi:hypothetical protein
VASEGAGRARPGGPSVRSSLAAVKDTPHYTYLVPAMAAIGGMLSVTVLFYTPLDAG